jgi:Na+(H+)/acetate symporter ActP
VNFPTTLLLVLAFAAANLPFLVERIFFVARPKSGDKSFGWRLLELVVLFFIVGGIAILLEGKFGDVHKQNWEFYAVNAALFLVFAYPGFVYRYLWRRRGA